MKTDRYFKDSDFLRSAPDERTVPLSKREIRILVCGLLGITPKSQVLDIGAGTGGLSLQSAKLAEKGKVYSVEYREDAVKLLQENIKHLNLSNVEVLYGKAPEVLQEIDTLRFNQIIIGGTDKKLKAIVKWCSTHMEANGSICATFITLENCVKCIKLFKQYFKDVEVTEVGIAHGKTVKNRTLMLAQNPIFLVLARRRG